MSNKQQQWDGFSYVLVADELYVYGPFQNEETAIVWKEQHHTFGVVNYLRVHTPWGDIGTVDKAHHCGIVL